MSLVEYIRDIVSFNLFRTIYNKLVCKYSDDECYYAFVNKMNDNSKSWGLSNTHWINPSGLGEDSEYSYSTARDLAKLAAIAYKSGRINPFWSCKNHKCKIIQPYIIPGYSTKIRYAVSTIPDTYLNDQFLILGAKTGSGDGYYTLVMICEVDGYVVSGAIMNAHSDDTRFEAMAELMEIAKAVLKGKNVNRLSVSLASEACALLIDTTDNYKCLYEQNADKQSPAMSPTKVMSFLTMAQYIDDFDKLITIKPYDVDQKYAKGDGFKKWQKVKLSSLIYFSLLPSSCTSANIIARHVGYKILNTNNTK